ncbi:MAG: VWA domain-containing protein [Candidatus Eisenbacteria bacterium]|nr:VWA domain-containing protein [Candidatus Eisenbacteria bacterium]
MTFLNAAFLFAALAALLPLVIHLISRRRVETVDWSSLRFLKELERRRIRRVRIRQILLLVLRSLIILLVALALARPTLEGPLAGNARARTSVAIVLDESASMDREASGTVLFDAAAARVREIVALLDEGDEAFLVSAAGPAASLVPDGTVSPDVVIQELVERAPADAATDYTGAVEKALAHLADARNLNREVYLVGDLAAAGWSGEPSLPDVGTDGAMWPPRVYVLPLEGPLGNNAVLSVGTERIYGGSRGRYAVTAEITTTRRGPLELPVRLFVDGVQVGQTGADLQAGDRATARFTVALGESDWHAGRVAIERDVFPNDDARFFVVPPSRTIEVLVARPEGAGEDAGYVERALDPLGTAERFRPVEVPVGEVAVQEQGRFPVVVLADVGRPGAEAERWLRRHVASGGGVLVVLGSRTDVRAWRGSALEELSGVRLVEPVERRQGVRLAPTGRGHPLLEGLSTGGRLIEDVVVRRALRADASGESVLELPGIGPALTFTSTGDGTVATLLFGLELEAGDLARSGLIVPLLHRVTERLSGGAPGTGQGVAGEPLELRLAAAPAGGIDVVPPSGATFAAGTPDGARPSVVIDDTREAGIYTVETPERTLAMGAVNLAPEESMLEPLERGELEDRLGGLPVVWIAGDETVADAVLVSRRGRELWRVFLYLALALLTVEMFLARPRGAGRRGGGVEG